MIRLVSGNLLEARCEALVNPVNVVGVMGKGLALQFKKAFPENYLAFRKACKEGKVRPGQMFIFELPIDNSPHLIINFPTKRHWRGNSRMEDIDAGLRALVDEIRGRGIRSIAIPPLGSGLGGLDWDDVRPRIEAALSGIENLDVIIYGPSGAPV